eukprot:jgi/Chlat1/3803/Chrsp259S03930
MCPTFSAHAQAGSVASKPAMDSAVTAGTLPAATPPVPPPVHSVININDHLNINNKANKVVEAPPTAALATDKQQPADQLSSAPVALPSTLPEVQQSNGLHTLAAGLDPKAESGDRFSSGKLGKGEDPALGLFAMLKPDVLKSLSVEQLEQQLISPDKFVSPLVTTYRPVVDIPAYGSSLSSPSTASTSTPSPGYMGPFSGPSSRVESDGLLTRHMDGNKHMEYAFSGPIGGMSQSFPSNGGYALASPSTRAVEGEEEEGVPGAMRRAQSAGDLRRSASGSFPQSYHHLPPGVNGGANSSEGNGKVGKLTLEERNMRISRYRQKRTARNFHKKITYVCRKTLADSRPRVRGRFACNDEDNLPMKQLDEEQAKDASNPQMLADFDIGSDFDELDLEPLSPNAFHELGMSDMEGFVEGTFDPAPES